jgi:hypothetical protein
VGSDAVMGFLISGKRKLTREIKGGLISFNTNCYKLKAPKKYKAELIRQETPEYIIWERYCINAIRGQSRKFGII